LTRIYNAVQHYLDRHLDEGRGGRVAITTRTESLSYANLLDRVERSAGVLHEAGVTTGERVLLVLPDCVDAVAFILGAMRIGAVPAPLHVSLADQEYRSIYEDCRPAAAIVSDEHFDRVSRLPAAIRSETSFFVSGSDVGRATPTEEALASAPSRSCVDCRPDAAALLQYTSGSTGAPKGVVHRHGAILSLPTAFATYLKLGQEDLCLSAAKLFFGYGLGNSLFFPLDAGATVLLREEPSDPVGVLQAISTAHPTVFFGSPTLYTAILALTGARSSFDLSSVRLYVSAGESLSARIFETWAERFGRGIVDGLGSTECLHIFAADKPEEAQPGRIGPAVPRHEVKVVGEDGNPVPTGTPGVAEVRGPTVSRCYWERPEETAKTMVDGWVRTGDLLREHADGSFEFVGREDDLFKVRGSKVAPLEIETRLKGHPAVADCAVVPHKDRWGLQESRAVICLPPEREPSAELEKELRGFLLATLPRHKVPRTMDFTRALPRTSTGKLARRRILEGQVDLI
jgi:benzoate-CoA ligase family protein